jgi:hypothetical protein
MNTFQHFADVPTPEPGQAWIDLSDSQRMSVVVKKLEDGPAEFSSQIEVASAKSDGQIIIRLRETLPPNRRGPFLLDFEAYLKEAVDDALVVWLEALGDRNSLRNLRGIEVKA